MEEFFSNDPVVTICVAIFTVAAMSGFATAFMDRHKPIYRALAYAAAFGSLTIACLFEATHASKYWFVAVAFFGTQVLWHAWFGFVRWYRFWGPA